MLGISWQMTTKGASTRFPQSAAVLGQSSAAVLRNLRRQSLCQLAAAMRSMTAQVAARKCFRLRHAPICHTLACRSGARLCQLLAAQETGARTLKKCAPALLALLPPAPPQNMMPMPHTAKPVSGTHGEVQVLKQSTQSAKQAP